MIKQKPLLLGALLCSSAFTLSCTTPIPQDEAQVQAAQEPKEQLSQSQRSAISSNDSLLTALARDPATLDAWEASDGWVMFYQGKLAEAIEAFGEPSPQTALGLARAHLELAESYQSFALATEAVAAEWLKLERQSPHAALYQRWLDWTEYSLRLSSPAQSQEGSAQLKLLRDRLSSLESMESWLKVASELKPEHAPREASAPYRLWLSFAEAVERARAGDQSALSQARKRQARLMKRSGVALIKPILVDQAQADQPEHKVFDPRLASVHSHYHALESLHALSKLSAPWTRLLQARAHSVLGQHARAQSALESLVKPNAALPKPSESFLLLTSHLTQADVMREVHARLISAHCKLRQLDQLPALLKTLKSDTEETMNATVWRLWAAASCKELIDADMKAFIQAQLKLFPQARRPLIQASFDLVKGPSAERLASLGVAERWLDELQHVYASAMSELDHRVPALNALSSAEDSGSPMRLGGHNRLGRLALSATHQIKLRRLRVASKYFLRLREQLPSVAALAEMTSDVLSGASFSTTGQVNAGQ